MHIIKPYLTFHPSNGEAQWEMIKRQSKKCLKIDLKLISASETLFLFPLTKFKCIDTSKSISWRVLN